MPWFRNLILIHLSSSAAFKTPSSLKPTTTARSLSCAFTHRLLQFSTAATEEKAAEVNDQGGGTGTIPARRAGLGATKGDEKPRVVVLGSGWAGCRLIKDLDTSIYDVVCVSPRNHMVFTPLLASTCVGTLEFRSVAEPIGRIQPAISREPGELPNSN